MNMLQVLKPFHCSNCELHFTGKDGYRSYAHSRYPFVLKCGHTVCESCVNISFKTHKNVTCSICKATTEFEPGTNPNSKLLPDVYVIGIVNCKQTLPSLKNKLKPAMTQNENLTLVPCDHCSMREASFRCKNCEENFCNICFDAFHRRSRKRGTHIPLPVYAEIYHSLVQEGCAQHENRPIEFYCEKDNQLICSYCVIKGDHNGHQVITLVEKNESCVEELKKARGEVVEFHKRLKLTEQKLSQAIPTAKMDLSVLVKDIRSHFHSLHSALLLRENELLQQIEDISNANISHLSKLKQEISDTMKDAESLLHDASAAAENPTLSISVPLIIQKLESIKNFPCHLVPIDDGDTDSNKNISLIFDDNLQSNVASYGKISAEVKPRFCLKSKDELPPDFEIEPLPIENNVETESLASDTFSDDSLNLCVTVNGHEDLNDMKNSGPPTAKFEKIMVSHIRDPTYFYIRKSCDIPKLENIMVRIRRYLRLNYHNLKALRNPSSINIGDIYLAQYSTDKKWYRARIKKFVTLPENMVKHIKDEDVESDEEHILKENGDYAAAQVFYMDFGNTEIIPLWRIIPAEKELLRYPDLVKKSSLHNIVPSSKNGEWTCEANAVFQKYVFNKEVNMQLIEERDGVMYVELSQITETNEAIMDVPTSVRDALIFLEHATFLDKSAVPKTSKKIRQFRKFLPPERIGANSRTTVNISHIETPSLFYVQQLSTSSLLSDLILEMQNAYSKDENNILGSLFIPHVGVICAAQFPEDQMWYRAEVLNLPGGAQVEVEFVDFGYKQVLHHQYLRQIIPCFTKLNKQAIPCMLADVSFMGEDGWSKESKDWLVAYSKEKRFQLLSLGFDSNSSKTKAVLFDVEKDIEICINALMVEEEMARGTGLYATAVRKVRPLAKRLMKSPENSFTVQTPLHNSEVSNNEIIGIEQNPAPVKNSPPAQNNPTSKKEDRKSKDYVKVILTHIENPGSFFVRLHAMEDEYKSLCKKMYETYENTEPSEIEIKKGNHYAAFRELDKMWYRIIAASTVEDETIEARFPDSGYYAKLSMKNIRNLHPEFLAEKAFAVPCFLPGVVPAGGSQKWSRIAIDMFREIVMPHNILYLAYSSLGESVIGNSMSVDLFYEDIVPGTALEPSTISYKSVTQRLIEGGVALPIRRKNKVANNKISVSDSAMAASLPEETLPDRENDNVAVNSLENLNEKEGELPAEVIRWQDAAVPDAFEFVASVTHVSDLGTIFLQKHPECVDNADMIKKALLCKYENKSFKPPRIPPPKGSACLAEFEIDHKYYRAEVISSSPEFIKVQFIDYGNFEVMQLKKIILDYSFTNIPKQCIECELSDVCPPDGIWPTKCLDLMHEMIVERLCTIRIVEPVEDGKKPLIALETNLGSFNTFVNSLFEIQKPLRNDSSESEENESFHEYSPPTPLRENSIFPICITYIFEPNLVHLQCLNVESPTCNEEKARNKEIREFLLLVNHLASYASDFPVVEKPVKGMACICQYSVDKAWYRCKILNIDRDKAHVLYVDYGNSQSVPLDVLKEADEYTLAFPIQAHLCKIHRIEPADHNWSSVAKHLLPRYQNPETDVFASVVTQSDLYEIQLLYQNPDGDLELLYQDLIDEGLLMLE